MDELTPAKKLHQLIQKYKYALVLLIIGLALMLIPGQETDEPEAEVEPVSAQTTDDLETRLENLLRQIDGAGEVRVLLTVETGEETIYQTDGQSGTDSDSVQQSSDTVIVEDSNRQESGLVRTVQSPVYRGAVIVCQGADKPTVRLAIVEAVRCATGLRTDQISVVKMN